MVIARFEQLQVTALLATASFAVYLTEQAIGSKKAGDLHLRKLCAGGEPGLQEQRVRDKVAAGWGISHIRETMGLADVLPLMYSECESGGGMHFNAGKYVALELIDPVTTGRVPWAEGARGEAVYTTFDREATPVLRYRSADQMEVTGTACGCGRTSPRLRCIGRTDDMLIYKAMNVFPSAIRDVVTRRFADAVEPHIRIWRERSDQVRFDGPIPVEVELKPGVAPETAMRLAELIGQTVRDELAVRVDAMLVPAGTLPRSAYKTPLVHTRAATSNGGKEK